VTCSALPLDVLRFAALDGLNERSSGSDAGEGALAGQDASARSLSSCWSPISALVEDLLSVFSGKPAGGAPEKAVLFSITALRRCTVPNLPAMAEIWEVIAGRGLSKAAYQKAVRMDSGSSKIRASPCPSRANSHRFIFAGCQRLPEMD
jgi:hypothetical protein